MINFKDNGVAWLRAISLGVILYVLFFVIFHAWFLIMKAVFNLEFLTDAVKDINEISLYVHSRLLSATFFLVVAVLIRKELSLISFALVLVFSFFVDFYGWLDYSVHPKLEAMNMYGFLLSKNVTVVNPQYTRGFLFLLVIIGLFVLLMIKKTRTMDRFFVFLIASSVVMTTFLFHAAIPMGLYKYVRVEKKESFFIQIEDLMLYGKCKSNCLITSTNNETKVKGDASLFEQHKGFIENSRASKGVSFMESGDFVGKQLVFMGCYNYKNNFYCVIDNKVIKNYGFQSMLWFSFLTSVAHVTWIFGGLALLWGHKYRKMRKLIS